jgi:hypothetical protein
LAQRGGKYQEPGKKFLINLPLAKNTHMRRNSTAYKDTVVKPKGRKRLGRARYIYEDNSKMNIKEKGRENLAVIIWLRIGSKGRLL